MIEDRFLLKELNNVKMNLVAERGVTIYREAFGNFLLQECESLNSELNKALAATDCLYQEEGSRSQS